MSLRSPGSFRSGFTSLRPRSMPARAAVVSTAAVSILLSLPAAAEDGQGVINKMLGAYASVHSFSGTLVKVQTGKTPDGKSGSTTETQSLKYKGPNQVAIKMTLVGAGAAAKVGKQEKDIISDGKMMYVYLPSQKAYQKSPAPPSVPWPFSQLLTMMVGQPARKFTLKGSTTVNGRPAYILETDIPVPPNATAEQKKMLKASRPPTLMVDKQNYHFLKMSAGGPRGSIAYSLDSQSINPDIPANAFSFAPPAGTREVKPPPPQGAPGAPGAPGGALPPGVPRK